MNTAQTEFFTSLYITYLEKDEETRDKEILSLLESEDSLDHKKAIDKIYNKYFSEVENPVIAFNFNGSGDSGEADLENCPSIIDIDDRKDYVAINDLFDIIGDLIDFDWYNNDGGSGTISVDLMTGIISVEGGYYSQVITEHNSIHFVE